MRIFRECNFRTGKTAVEYSFLLAGFVIAILMAIGVYNLHPDLLDTTLWVTITGALIGGIAWTARRSIQSLDNRTQLLIVEIMSDAKPRRREDILALVRSQKYVYWLLPGLTTDSLATLLREKKIQIVNGMYSVWNDPIEAVPSQSRQVTGSL